MRNMNMQLINGIPENLEELLRDFISGVNTNITADELRHSVVGYTKDLPRGFKPGKMVSSTGKMIKPAGEESLSSSIDVYCFFPPYENSTNIHKKEINIALQPEKYGFMPDRRVQIHPSRLELGLSRQARLIYDGILDSQEIGVSQLLEDVGFIVNHSMEYDFDKFIRLSRKPKDYTHVEAARKYYRPTGEEVNKGICTDAGKMIRRILGSLRMEDKIKYIDVGTVNSSGFHDTTVIFDKVSGEWAVINSKSPILSKQYNLMPEDKLPDLGSPYFRRQQN